MKSVWWVILLFLIGNHVYSQNTSVRFTHFHDGIHHWNLVHPVRNYPRLDTSQYLQIADNFICWQNQDGGWPKNVDWLGIFNIDSVKLTRKDAYLRSTLDNRNICPQVEYLSMVYVRTGLQKYRKSAEQGIIYILNMQNASGGWRGWDVDAITYNDDVMFEVMNLFLNIKEKKHSFGWVTDSLRNAITGSLSKAIDVTLRCQIKVNGQRTAWCQQHDHVTLQPVKARSFELPAITANESCNILLFLMRLKNPTSEVVEAVKAGVMWLQKSAIPNTRVDTVRIPKERSSNHEYPYDLVVVRDTTAKPIWARYYEVETNLPFMCNRDGIKVYKLEHVEAERRVGYAWYGYWPDRVFAAYEKWKARVH